MPTYAEEMVLIGKLGFGSIKSVADSLLQLWDRYNNLYTIVMDGMDQERDRVKTEKWENKELIRRIDVLEQNTKVDVKKLLNKIQSLENEVRSKKKSRLSFFRQGSQKRSKRRKVKRSLTRL